MTEGTTNNPIIVERNTPQDTPSPPSLVTPSPDRSHTSNPSNSSRPHSQCSGNTSQPRPLSPLEGKNGRMQNVPASVTTDSSPANPPEVAPLPPSALPPSPQLPGESRAPRLVPSPAITSAPTSNCQDSWLSSLRAKTSKRRWLENIIGMLGLATALWLGVRGYKLAVWQSWNDMRQTCATFKQSNLSLGTRCTEILEQGDPPDPPYWIGKYSTPAASRLTKRQFVTLCFNPGGCYHDAKSPSHLLVPYSAIIVAICMILGIILIRIIRRNSQAEDGFTSSARLQPSHVQLTRYHDEGPETISGEGVVLKQKPQDKDYPHQVRRRIRSSQDKNSESNNDKTDWPFYNNSVDTLVTPWKGSEALSKVSLHDHSAHEKHENLIELDVAGKRKAFFKPSTGEYIHLKPWKSTHSKDEVSGDEKWLTKAEGNNSIHRALGQMVFGGVSWAVGKTVDNKLHERLQKEVVERRLCQPPQRVGDCLAGEMTNEWPSGKPTLG